MLTLVLILNAVLGVQSFLADTYVSSCKDLDTDACRLFNSSDPNLCSKQNFAQNTCKRFCGNCPVQCFSCTSSTRDPKSCNTTIPCDKHKACMLKRLVATDDSHEEYIMSCERKEICEGLVFGFGKRQAEIDSRTREIDKRNVYIDCCNSDFCNTPGNLLSTMAPTIRTTIKPNYGETCFRDIVFVLDDSNSVGNYENFKHVLTFVSDLVRQISIGPQHANIALVTFSYSAKVQWYLKDFQDRQNVLNAIRTVHHEGGNTNTESALHLVRTDVLTDNHGDRAAAENAVLVLTDGNSNNKHGTLQEAHLLKTVAKDVVSLIVGQRTDLSEINAIATDSNHVVDIHSFSHLDSVIPQMLQLICS